MTLDEQFFIDRIHGGAAKPNAPQGPATTPEQVENSSFRKLLDKLDGSQAAATGSEQPGDGAGLDSLDKLQHDLHRADDEFLSAMDLRRKLEEAYRRLGP